MSLHISLRCLLAAVLISATGALAAKSTIGQQRFSTNLYLVAGSELRHAAQLGDPQSQFELAWQYMTKDEDERFEGFSYDPRAATYWYAKAARQGHTTAAYNLAIIYAQGRGVSTDPVKAYAWLDFAAKAGHGKSRDLRPSYSRSLTETQRAEALSLQQRLVAKKVLRRLDS